MKNLILILVALFATNSLMAQTDLEKDKKVKEIILKDIREKGIQNDKNVQIALNAARDAVLFKAWAQLILEKNPVTQSLKEALYKEQSDLLGKNEYRIFHVFVVDEKAAKIFMEKMNAASDWTTIEPKKVFDSNVKYSFNRTDWINISAILPDFRQTVANMAKGTYAASPIRVKDGWHIVGLLDSRPFVMPAIEKIDKELTALAERKILDSQIQSLLSTENRK